MKEHILYTQKKRTNLGKRVVLDLTCISGTRVDLLNYKYAFWLWPRETLLGILSRTHEVWPGQKNRNKKMCANLGRDECFYYYLKLKRC